jgi:FtsP/CotA-like multicopper oxidase with cupredoxin domain
LHGWEVKYRYFTINGKCLGFGEPIRVKEGQRVLFHVLNASATESVRLALPGHRFQVVALDGNPVPRPALVDVLELGTAERIDAIVTMDSPGVFVLGTPKNTSRAKGLGIVVEYANRGGKPLWVKPPNSNWDYTIFGDERIVPKPDEVIPLVIGQGTRTKDGFESWTINGKGYDESKPVRLARGRRCRLVFDNQTEDAHPVHLHRSSFELTSVSGTPTAGIIKDVVLVKGYQKVEVDVTPSMAGLHLFHCHQQLHMDYGFKMLFDVA